MARAWILWAAAIAAGCSGGGGSSCPNDLPAACPANAAGYTATIAPLLAERCVACHSPGGTSAHYLQTYAEVSNLAGPVLDQVYACRMPPADYPALTETERQDLLGWLVCGAPDD
jgi:uncharacterized membrane protein